MNKHIAIALLIPLVLLLARQIRKLWEELFVDPYGDREFRSALRKIEKEKRRMRP
jgi:hypothetical protein